MISKDFLNLGNVVYKFLFGKIGPCNPAKMVGMQCPDLVYYKIAGTFICNSIFKDTVS